MLSHAYPHIHFEIEAGENHGLGHLSRCCCLAHEWNKKVVRLTRNDSGVGLSGVNFPASLYHLPKSLGMEQGGAHGPDLVILDGASMLPSFYDFQGPMIVIDDQGTRNLQGASCVINPNGFAKDFSYEGMKSMCGVDFSLVRQDVFAHRQPYDPASPVIGVIFGGSDPLNLTVPFSTKLIPLVPSLQWRIIFGPFAKEGSGLASFPNVSVYRNPENLYELLGSCRFVVTAAGSSVYELAALGVPSLSLEVFENQKGMAAWLNSAGLGIGLGYDFSWMELEDAFHLMNDEAERRAGQSAKGTRLLDGGGPKRVIDRIEGFFFS